MKTKIINLYAGPGSGKSTGAAGLFHLMKVAGMEVELATEYAKDLVWADRQADFKYQFYVTAKQAYRIERLIGKVEYVITDSPILLGCVYTPKDYYPSYKSLLWEIHKTHDSFNFFLTRQKKYNPNGRNQTEEEAIKLDEEIKDLWYLSGNKRYEVNGNGAAKEIFEIIKHYNEFSGK